MPIRETTEWLSYGLLRVGIVGPDGEDAAVGKLHVLDQSEIASIFGEDAVDRSHVARLQSASIAAAQAGSSQRARSRHFERPTLHVAFVIGNVHVQIRMRIDPLDLGDLARNGDRLL